MEDTPPPTPQMDFTAWVSGQASPGEVCSTLALHVLSFAHVAARTLQARTNNPRTAARLDFKVMAEAAAAAGEISLLPVVETSPTAEARAWTPGAAGSTGGSQVGNGDVAAPSEALADGRFAAFAALATEICSAWTQPRGDQ